MRCMQKNEGKKQQLSKPNKINNNTENDILRYNTAVVFH